MKKNWNGLNILIVEDDVFLLEVLCDYFKKTKATVFQAVNGEEAFAIVDTDAIDFVLSDVQMPVMDGVELLKKIRIKRPDVPIILLATGQSQLTKESAIEFGASGLIHKPFNLTELSEEIEKLVQSRLKN
jgi:DNA-binding response OmpR family regulator